MTCSALIFTFPFSASIPLSLYQFLALLFGIYTQIHIFKSIYGTYNHFSLPMHHYVSLCRYFVFCHLRPSKLFSSFEQLSEKHRYIVSEESCSHCHHESVYVSKFFIDGQILTLSLQPYHLHLHFCYVSLPNAHSILSMSLQPSHLGYTANWGVYTSSLLLLDSYVMVQYRCKQVGT